MIIALTNGLYDLLAASSALVAELDDWNGEPAIIAQDPVPPGVDGVYVAISPPFSALPFDTKDRDGHNISLDIGINGPRDSYNRVDRAASAALAAVHRRALTVSGYQTLILQASGPVGAPTDDTMTSRVVTVSAVLRSNTLR